MSDAAYDNHGLYLQDALRYEDMRVAALHVLDEAVERKLDRCVRRAELQRRTAFDGVHIQQHEEVGEAGERCDGDTHAEGAHNVCLQWKKGDEWRGDLLEQSARDGVVTETGVV